MSSKFEIYNLLKVDSKNLLAGVASVVILFWGVYNINLINNYSSGEIPPVYLFTLALSASWFIYLISKIDSFIVGAIVVLSILLNPSVGITLFAMIFFFNIIFIDADYIDKRYERKRNRRKR